METSNEKLAANLSQKLHKFISITKNINIFIYSLIFHFKIYLIIQTYKGNEIKLKNVLKIRKKLLSDIFSCFKCSKSSQFSFPIDESLPILILLPFLLVLYL